MKQIEFSKYIQKFLTEKFPEFIPNLKYQKDFSFDCSTESPSKIFSIWIATYNFEITIGLEDPKGETDIHTHISCYDNDGIEVCLAELTTKINDIKSGKVILYLNDKNIYDWINASEFPKMQNAKAFSWV